MNAIASLIDRLIEVIIVPLIVLLLGVALLMFLWGGVEFLMNLNSEEGRRTGTRHMIWGIVGMFIMLSAWGILEVLVNTFNLPAP